MIRGNELAIRGCELLSKLIKQSTMGDWDRYRVPLSPSGRRPPFLWKVSYIIWFSLDHPGSTLVSHPDLYLSARPINHSF